MLSYRYLCITYLPVCLYSQVKAKFTVDDHSHYLFTPCILTEWVLSLLRYDLTAGNQTHMQECTHINMCVFEHFFNRNNIGVITRDTYTFSKLGTK